MVGQNCWNASRNGIGSNLLLRFGNKVCDVPPYIFSHTGKVRIVGEYNLTIFCSWRLETNDEVLCTWQDCMLADGEPEKEDVLAAFRRLEECVVESTSITWPSGDLVVRFSNDLALFIFCDLPALDSDGNCYFFSTMDTLFVVEGRGALITEALTQQYYKEEELIKKHHI